MKFLANIFLIGACVSILSLGCARTPQTVEYKVNSSACQCQTTEDPNYKCECDPCKCAEKAKEAKEKQED